MLMERGEVVSMGDPELVGSRYLELNFRREQVESGEAPPSDEQERFGDGSARFTQMWIQTPADEPLEAAHQGEEFVIRGTVEFHRDVDDPAVGLTIENADHYPVFATSSVWMNERTGSFKAGETGRLSVRMPNVLAPGRYFVTPHIARRGSGHDLLDRYPRMISFLVTGTRETGGMVELEHDLSFERVEQTQPVTS
jgi:hypothetical protein